MRPPGAATRAAQGLRLNAGSAALNGNLTSAKGSLTRGQSGLHPACPRAARACRALLRFNVVLMPPTQTARLLLIEDQRDIAANIWDYFERRGYAMDHARDGRRGLELALEGRFDLIILDLGLPRLDGMELCRRLRAAGHEMPVLMLTARDALEDKLRGLRDGADDYVVKPVVLCELEARVRALLRRGLPLPGGRLQADDLEFDSGSFVVHRGGRQLALTRMQMLLLERLLLRAPNVVTHEELGRVLWGDGQPGAGSLHTHMHALRITIDRPFERSLIRTVRGLGYRIDVPRRET